MKCPSCGHRKSIVADASRNLDTGETYRTRQCKSCDHTWFTREVIYSDPLPSNIRIRYRPRLNEQKERGPKLSDEERQYRSRVRRQARLEALKTGEEVEAIYQRWGVPTIRPTFRRNLA